MKKLYTLMVVAGAPFRATAPQLKGTFKMKSKSLILLVTVALAGFLPQSKAALTVNLGTASSFAVLAGSGITVAAPNGPTTITGDIGTFPTTSITGFGNVVLNGVNHAGDGVTQGAKNDLVTAYNDAAGRTPTTLPYSPVFDLVGLTLTSGVYNDPTAFEISGTLTLDAQGNPNAVWIFQAGSTLTTASGSKVVFKDGIGDSCNVFWQVGSSATLGTHSDFVGTIMALTSITATTGATVDGRLLADANGDGNGAVTLDNNTINATCVAAVPEPSSFWPLAFFTSVFGAWQWLAMWRRKLGRC
jgi:hypothetical protein